MNELRQLFESSYPGKEVIFEKLIKPIFPKAEDTIKSTSLELGENEKDKIESFHIFAQQSGAFEITFADIELKPYINLKRNRVTIQNCIRRVLNNHSNALIFFHHADNPDEWRFSYVYRETSNKTSTSAKRYTYLCGKNHACRTVAQRFKELAKNKITDESLLRAFSVEALTKEFFAELFAWYEWACEVAKFPAENSKGADVELTKDKNNLQLIRLITRIIFVWFIKHKDLIPTWLFNKNELEQILADCDLNSLDKGNYYNAILQNLFFATLNKKIEERSFANNSNGEKNDNHYGIKTLFRDDNKESFFKIEQNEIIEKFKSVPFLNGGLFECLDCDENDDNNTKHIVRYIDGFSREKERRAFVPNELFWNDEKGLINILNRYNFTVEENTPTDVQVALDPELLGKVFENLLGTYNPETHESARKDSGSFYTPREIVSYMVNSSIKSHLQSKVPDVSEENLERLTNDDKSDDVDIELTQEQIEKIQKALFEIKIIDPACGSGAFPMGILNKLVNIHILLNNLSAKKDTQTNLTIKKGQCINYTPRNSELEIKAEYLGNKNFTLEVNGEKDTLIYDSQKLALHVKEVINQYNKQHGKKTIANLFSQGRIDDNETFNTIKSKREIKRIVDEDTNEIIWQYKTYNVENKFRQYRKDEQTTISDNANEEEDYEHAKDLYNLKLKIIEESIFGVDIQPIAIQICKLRFFISLICEQEKENKPEENYGYPPLPNLETKFVTANALIGIAKLDTKKETFDLFKTDEISNKQKELQEIRHNHFGVKNVDEKIKIRRKDRKLRAELAELLEKTNVFAPEDAMQLANWNPYDQNAVSDFFDTEWMFGIKDGFDIVIGNPPYGAKISAEDKKYYTKNYEVAKTIKGIQKGSTDTFAIFINQGFNFLKNGGNLAYIVPMAVTSSDAMTALHNMLEKSCRTIKISSYSNRPKQIFDAACIRTSIIQFEKTGTKTEKVYTSKLVRRSEADSISSLIANLTFIDSYKYKLNGRYAKIGSKEELKIIEKLFTANKRLEDYKEESGNAFYYRVSGGRYFNVVTNMASGSSQELPFYCENNSFLAAILSTSLFWFYQQAYTDGLHLKQYEINSFPVPDISKIEEDKILEIEKTYAEYLEDIDRNAIEHKTNSYNVSSFKEYKIRKSKKLIDRLDDLICPLYGLTAEQIDFIKNYEIQYRISNDE